MRIQIASDLHLEQRPGCMPDPNEFCPAIDRDVLVLAGDIGAGMSARRFIEREARISPVIYVPGNHEYDTAESREDLDRSWRALAAGLPGLHYLAGDAIEIGGARFWGAPWHSDLFGRRDASHLDWINGVVTDFQARPDDTVPWTVGHHLETHWLQTENLLAQTGFLEVVITHWPPVTTALSPQHRSNLLAGYWVNDREDLVREIRPQLWISGNVHGPHDVMVGVTRCVANTTGDPVDGTGMDGFEPDRVVEVDLGMIYVTHRTTYYR